MNKLSAISSCLICCLLPAVTQAALVSVYEFNESSGTTASDSVRGAPGVGTMNGGTSFVPGKIGNAVEFNGSTGFITALNTVPTGTTAYSVAAWVWTDTSAVWGSIVKNWGAASVGSFHFGFDGTSGRRMSNFLTNGTSVTAPAASALSLNTWHHVALTYDGATTTQRLYINGSQVSVNTAAPASLTALGTLMGIGAKLNDAQTGPAAAGNVPGFWDGKIDDLAFWNHRLTAAEVLAIKNNGDLGIGVVPEPASAALLGLAGLGFMRRRR